MSPPERLDDIAAVYATRTWHRTEGDPPMPDPHASRPDCERHGCSADAGGWVHTDDCKRAFAVVQHQTWPARPAVEVQARTIHARYLRDNLPGVTDAEILRDWDQLSAEGRQWLLGEANRLINIRAARPGKPDNVEALVAKLTGETTGAITNQPGMPSPVLGVGEGS
jgi:hypothetical protein